MEIAFFGLGNMGLPMAVNLRKAGHAVCAFDVSAQAVNRAREAGLDAVGSIPLGIPECDAIISMLPTSESVEALYLAPHDGLFHKPNPASLFIDCSTVAPETARRVAATARVHQVAFLDAPVSGGTRGAAEGTLTFLVGGEEAALERARPLLECMGKKIFHLGNSGAGQAAKLCNNMLLAIHMLGTAEALLLGEANGLDPKVLSEVMAASSGRNWSLETYNPFPGVLEGVPASRGYQGGFSVELMEKDLRLAQEAASLVGTSTPLGALAYQLYRLHGRQGAKKLDFSSIIQMLGRT